MVDTSVNYLAQIATPLALIVLGGHFDHRKVSGNIKLSVVATVTRLILIPFVAVVGAVLLGFRGYELGAIYILFSAPTAVSSFPMAKSMNSDAELAGQIIIFTTFFSMFTVFVGVYVLKALGLI